jgi:cellulose synthase/poly-beta-1,6-N-acetylglucosamine synthase-like glycosyltransferase
VRRNALTPDIAFLARRGVPEKVLRSASRLAVLRGTWPSQELAAFGFSRTRYFTALAADLGVAFLPDLDGAELVAGAGIPSIALLRRASLAMVRIGGAEVLAVAPGPDAIGPLAEHLRSVPSLARRIRIVSPETLRAFLAARRHRALRHYAINRLAMALPRLSARRLIEPRGRPPALLAALLAAFLLGPETTTGIAGLFLSMFFLNCCAWKLAAALHCPSSDTFEALPTAALPTYTLLVPLYREASIVPGLLQALTALDYPESKLQILIILEADDRESRRAVAAHAASPLIEVVIVPPGEPRTKPKALTYALAFARGDMVVVYDAEDRPEPDQLRRAAAAFAKRADLGCVQARLIPDNEATWFSRMFALEYAANFEVLLPALASFRAPLPLGGTSNHFPRKILEEVGGWDPFNVTEDADLGVRLARFGYRSATIVSHTFEEAPERFAQWLPQRRRWIKGWLQTALLAVRGPVSKSLRLSIRERFAFHGVVSAGVVGLLLYPAAFYLIFSATEALARGELPMSWWQWTMLTVNTINLSAVLLTAAISSWRGLAAVGKARLAWLIPLLPLYWALMSFAAWQALVQLIRDPWRWEKTEHGVASRPRRGRGGAPLASSIAPFPPPLGKAALQDVGEIDDAGKYRPVRRPGGRLRGKRKAG